MDEIKDDYFEKQNKEYLEGVKSRILKEDISNITTYKPPKHGLIRRIKNKINKIIKNVKNWL